MRVPGPKAELEHGVRALVDRIIAVGPSTPVDPAHDAEAAAPDVLDLEGLLAGGAHSAFNQLSGPELDRLRRKIEVARKLYQRYERDLSRPATTTPLSAAGVNQLCAVMLLASLYERDARFLNSALKVIDELPLPFGARVSQELATLAQATLDTLIPMERT